MTHSEGNKVIFIMFLLNTNFGIPVTLYVISARKLLGYDYAITRDKI